MFLNINHPGRITKNTYLPLELNMGFMGETIISPITSDGKITLPRELIEKFNLKDFVEIEETLCNKGILIRKHSEEKL
ncbi:hypothetical protein MNV_560051 [Candidatus Methanoperedens nitroreducens]|uniref:SpoVT-AbrB domain-containing protein n=2 Tax=Candidatus Methanoperedens nitratireducens TaxID=1392998 RepID=A0A284VRT8_9EURY|nr:hypothetical protein MNV_560051 [Candidatus Methanoperedens nitroreducens]